MTGDTDRADARLMSWDSFKETFLDPRLPADVPIAGDPPITIFTEPGRDLIGMRIELRDLDQIPSVSVRSIVVEQVRGELVMTARQAELHQPFYAFLLDVSDRIQLDQKPVHLAFEESLARWRRLLVGVSLMPEAAQLGLTGELWLLDRLIASRGEAALDTWTAVSGDAHDFRIGARDEIEVKTTSGERRSHIISRLDQLQPSPGADLHILSLQLVGAGPDAGWTIPEQIDTIRARLSAHPDDVERLNAALADRGWSDADVAHYPRRYKLRTPPRLVPVDESCPRITPDDIDALLGPLASRIGDVQYRVDLDGLGYDDGSPAFHDVLPAAPA
jgi:hypothetical protein